jgi:hypothetical protein
MTRTELVLETLAFPISKVLSVFRFSRQENVPSQAIESSPPHPTDDGVPPVKETQFPPVSNGNVTMIAVTVVASTVALVFAIVGVMVVRPCKAKHRSSDAEIEATSENGNVPESSSGDHLTDVWMDQRIDPDEAQSKERKQNTSL